MIDKFRDFVVEHSLFDCGDNVLVAVSGGVDSMTLLALMRGCGYKFAVAHCNFGLRGGESDAEQALVERTCAGFGVDCFTANFDTKGECVVTGESTQMAARRLRYAFFDELCAEHGFTKIAIAHHSDDSAETFFINLIRGTGLRGLTGISVVNGKVVRPLLFASRDLIERYAIEHKLDYMTDSSNLSDDYLRNRLRHDILPRLGSMSSSFGRIMSGNILRLEQSQRFIDSQVARIGAEVFVDGVLDLERVRGGCDSAFILYELLSPLGFSAEVVADILGAELSGKRFYASGYVATLDRGRLLVDQRRMDVFDDLVIDESDERVEWLTVSDLDSLATDSNVALLCGDALQFPLRVRRWAHGDWFMPLGMHSQKLVSDFLIDCKVSLPDKERQGVLTSGDTIVWLVGRRIDDRYKVTETSRRVLRLTL